MVGDEEMQCPPSPLLFDTALALEDQTIRAIAEAPMDILTSGQDHDLSETDDMSAADQVRADYTAVVQSPEKSSTKTSSSLLIITWVTEVKSSFRHLFFFSLLEVDQTKKKYSLRNV